MSETFLDYYDGWQSFLGLMVGHSCVESVTARSLNMRNILETGECIDAAVRLGEGGQNKRRGRRRARTREKLWLTVMLGRGQSGGAQRVVWSTTFVCILSNKCAADYPNYIQIITDPTLVASILERNRCTYLPPCYQRCSFIVQDSNCLSEAI
jgi:hypothetical protein